MGDFLKNNAPWSQLVTDNNISIHHLVPGREVNTAKSLKLTPIKVPHRGELSDTLAYVIRGSKKKIFYCPDIDSWDLWEQDVVEFITRMDIALVDGTFFSIAELSKRNVQDIPHPFVEETVKRLIGVKCEIYFIHLNHTNPLVDEFSQEKRWVENKGFKIGRFGKSWQLDRDG
jgi:pyrroloquinoline quinone biosynthesis protein B